MNYPTLLPVRNHLRVLPSASRHKGIIELPDNYQNAIATCMIIERGPFAHRFLKKYDTVMVNPLAEGKRRRITDDGEFMVPDTEVLGVIRNHKFFPLRKEILFERDRATIDVGSGIVLPETRRNQSHFGWVRRFGMDLIASRKRKSVIQLNSYCRLTQWKESHRHFSMEGKQYLLIGEDDLLYEQCN